MFCTVSFCRAYTVLKTTHFGPDANGLGGGNMPFIGNVQLPTTAGGSGILLLSSYPSCPFPLLMIGGAGDALLIPVGARAAGGGTGLEAPPDGAGGGGGGGGTERAAPPGGALAAGNGGASSSSSEYA